MRASLLRRRRNRVSWPTKSAAPTARAARNFLKPIPWKALALFTVESSGPAVLADDPFPEGVAVFKLVRRREVEVDKIVGTAVDRASAKDVEATPGSVVVAMT
jgi:hypothetical protein